MLSYNWERVPVKLVENHSRLWILEFLFIWQSIVPPPWVSELKKRSGWHFRKNNYVKVNQLGKNKNTQKWTNENWCGGQEHRKKAMYVSSNTNFEISSEIWNDELHEIWKGKDGAYLLGLTYTLKQYTFSSYLSREYNLEPVVWNPEYIHCIFNISTMHQ